MKFIFYAKSLNNSSRLLFEVTTIALFNNNFLTKRNTSLCRQQIILAITSALKRQLNTHGAESRDDAIHLSKTAVQAVARPGPQQTVTPDRRQTQRSSHQKSPQMKSP